MILGFVTNRLNVSITGFERSAGATYVPAWPEYLITLMLVGVGFSLFRLAVTYLPVYPPEEDTAVGAAPAVATAPPLLRPAPAKT